jgi:MerR family transcriptional regulator, copper efflux regulator
MDTKLTIGNVARRTGLTSKTIRFYEDEGLVPRPSRTDSGYRVYSEADVQRLQLVRRARLLGLDLSEVKDLVEQAFSADCASFGHQLVETIDRQRAEVERRIAELQAMKTELDTLEQHVVHCCEGCSPTELASQCGYCFFISDEEGGETHASD